MDQPNLKRISLMIREDQYEQLSQMGLNLSGMIRDLLDDYLSEHKITLSVSQKTRDLYNKIVSNTGATDDDIEPYFVVTLEELLQGRIEKMQELHKSVFGKK